MCRTGLSFLGASECRNKSLQLMFQLMGGGDKAGSGMDKTAVQVVVTARVEGSVTNARMQEITGEHSKDITGVLQTLVRDGLLTQQNQRRWASYRVAGDSPQLGEDSPHLAGDSPHLAGDSLHIVGDSPHNTGDSPRTNPLVWAIGEPARAKARLAPESMKALILAMCTDRWLSSREVADALSREPQKLQTRFLTMLVREGLLELRYPGVPNRPDQAYRAIVKTTP